MIRCHNISKTFLDKQVLNSVSLEVDNGQIVSLVGKNGAGKSTLIGVLAGYFKKDSGNIEKKNLSIMPDANSLYENITGAAFLKYMASLKNATNKLEYMDLAGKLFLTDSLKKRIGTYSFGMRKKIGFIQACLGSFDAYIFDEPTSGVDEPSAITMMQIIHDLKRNGAAVFLTSHNLDEVERVSDYVYVIDSGTIINQGTVQEIVTSKSPDHDLIYILKTPNFNDVYKFIHDNFAKNVKVTNIPDPDRLMIQVADESQMSKLVLAVLEKGYSVAEFYLHKKTLREKIYNQA